MFFDQHGKMVRNYRFWVFIGVAKISFTSVSGLEVSLNKEYYSEGGNNAYPQLMITPSNERNTLRFERGVQSYHLMLSRMKPGVSIPGGVTILVMNDNNFPVHAYHASDVVVTKWEVSGFDATGDQVLIETFELSYTELDRTNLQLM